MDERILLPDLQNEEGMNKIIDDFLIEHERNGFPKVVIEMSDIVHRLMVEVVFEHAESPIEIIFLNSLTLHFLTQAPLGLFIKGPVDDFVGYANQCYEIWDMLNHIHSDLTKETGTSPELSDFLSIIQNLAYTAGQEDILGDAYFFAYLMYMDINFVCLVMQSGFPSIRIDNKAIRTDMALFSPKNKSLRVVVECDGYNFHSDKDTFRRDRIRDRKLKQLGFDTLRFSGTEIYNNPVKSSHGSTTFNRDGLENLKKAGTLAQSGCEKRKPETNEPAGSILP